MHDSALKRAISKLWKKFWFFWHLQYLKWPSNLLTGELCH